MNNPDVIKTNQRKDTGNKVSVDDEVQKLFQKGINKITKQDYIYLKNKYGDDKFADQVQQIIAEKYNEITKKAKKFAHLIREKYANSNYPYHILLEKAYKYKVKYNLSTAEFAEFQKIYETELSGFKQPAEYRPATNIEKVLGNVAVDYSGFGKLSENDYKILQEILKLHATTKSLHSQVLLQSIQYQDCAIEAISGQYDKNLHTVTNHIHPVIAALFLPKINSIENHFLHSNFSNLVKTRYNKDKFTSMADALLFDSITKDPNDVVCDSTSILLDLLNRAQLQVQLWNSVLSLRNGQYYKNSFHEFISAIDTCKMNKYDTPDLVYGRYDGTILKRFLSAFSFRPTIITAISSYNPFSVNPYQQNIRPTISYVPMINLKLPYTVDTSVTISLNDAIKQTQLLLENGVVLPKFTEIIYSKDVIFFYVDRRATIIRQQDRLFGFNIPTAISGFERLNKTPVEFDTQITIRNDIYQLRSVIISEINDIAEDKDIVVGSSTLIMLHPDIEGESNRISHEYFKYDPYSVVKTQLVNNNIIKYVPTRIIPAISNDDEEGFMDMAKTRGTIFMYQLVSDKSLGVIAF
jgi:hypothetical protein